MLYLEFTHSQSFETFVRCHVHAFTALGGVTALWRARHKRVYVKDRIMRRKSSGNAKRVAVVHGSFA
jgi:transposase